MSLSKTSSSLMTMFSAPLLWPISPHLPHVMVLFLEATSGLLMYSILAKMSCMLDLTEFCLGMVPAPLLNLVKYLFQCSCDCSVNIAMGSGCAIWNNCQLWAHIWWRDGFIGTQGHLVQIWDIMSMPNYVLY